MSTGTFVLAAAGLLDGRRATTHPSYSELLEKLGVNYVRDYSVEDGKFLTMEGVSSAIDTRRTLKRCCTPSCMGHLTATTVRVGAFVPGVMDPLPFLK